MEKFCTYKININNLYYNLNNIKEKLNKKVKLCAIVKCNAYSVGLKTICKLLKNKVDFFGVAYVFEAMQIREFDKNTNIIVLGEILNNDLIICSQNNISISVSSLTRLKEINKYCVNIHIKIHIKIDTGLNRYGVKNLYEYKKMLAFIDKKSNLFLEGIFTHFATKRNDIQYLNFQFERFNEYVKCTKNIIAHCSNSFATSFDDKYHLDMVRCGFNLFGQQKSNYINLLPVVSIESKIIYIHNVKKGESIGYDRTCVAKKNMKVAVVSIGYGDGLNRRLSNNFSLIVNNCLAPIIGNICMDCCMIDVTKIPVFLLDSVIILGKSLDYEITLNNYANVLGTSPYEILINFRKDRMNEVFDY